MKEKQGKRQKTLKSLENADIGNLKNIHSRTVKP